MHLIDKDSSKLHIDLTNQFSSTIFNIPAYSLTCKHFKCFNLKIYLLTQATIPICTRHLVILCAYY